MEPFPKQTPETIDVEMNDWAFALAHEEKILKTEAVCPCIAIAIYSSQGTYLGHFSDVQGYIKRGSLETEPKTLDKMLEDAKNKISVEDAKVWLGGASPASDEIDSGQSNPTAYAELTFDNFVFVSNKLKELGFKPENIEECMSGYDEELDLSINSFDGSISFEATFLDPFPSFANEQQYWDFKRSKDTTSDSRNQ